MKVRHKLAMPCPRVIRKMVPVRIFLLTNSPEKRKTVT